MIGVHHGLHILQYGRDDLRLDRYDDDVATSHHLTVINATVNSQHLGTNITANSLYTKIQILFVVAAKMCRNVEEPR